jgi:curved DNA-binding protein
MTHYETLGVSPTATPEELKSAYRKLAKQHHPDLGGDAAKFQQINEAYETLSDVNKKNHYDHTLKNPHPHMNRGNPHGPFEFQFGFGPGNDPFNIHDQIFQQFGFNMRQQPRNRNIRVELQLDFVSTLRNQSKIIEYRTSNSNERLQVDIPAGVTDNTVFNINGRGDDANNSVPRGNLEVFIRVLPHNRFHRSGDNIVEDHTIDCFQAITGCVLQLDLPSGRRIELNIPPGTQHQSQFGITDEGFPRHNTITGKYIARINVLIPTALTQEQLDLVHQIQLIKPVNT